MKIRTMLRLLLALALADILSTMIALNLGAIEVNPVYHGRLWLIPFLRIGYVAFCAVDCVVLWKYNAPPLLKAIMRLQLWGSIVVGAAACIWNISVIVALL